MEDGKRIEQGSFGHGEEGRSSQSPIAIQETEKGDRPARRTRALGTIYILETTDHTLIKIGYTNRLIMRFEQLQRLALNSIGSDLRLIGFFPGTRQTEAFLHNEFASCRVHGEWYRRPQAFERLASPSPVFCIPTDGGSPDDLKIRKASNAGRTLAAVRKNPGRKPFKIPCPWCLHEFGVRDLRAHLPHCSGRPRKA